LRRTRIAMSDADVLARGERSQAGGVIIIGEW
jgi:hypothetical protein